MLKNLGVLLGGVFVGAVAAEIIRKKCPGLGGKLYAKISSVTTGIKDAFMAGYENATRAQRAAEAAEPA